MISNLINFEPLGSRAPNEYSKAFFYEDMFRVPTKPTSHKGFDPGPQQ
jgi:hypothetical protein